MQRVAKARSSLEEVVNTYDTWKTTQQDLAGHAASLKKLVAIQRCKKWQRWKLRNCKKARATGNAPENFAIAP
jgi:hypothetical protein